MPIKKIIGWSIVAIWLIVWVADTFNDLFADFGWQALWLTPVAVIATFAIIAFISWLID